MSLPASFANNTTPTGQQLDDTFAALGALTPIPCGVSGTNTIALTPEADTPTITAYANYGQYSGIAAASNTGAVTAQVGSLAALAVYKDTIGGPKALTGGEIIINCSLILMYDSTLNSSAGGFHLISAPSRTVRSLNTLATLTFGALTPQTASLVTVTITGCSVNDVISLGLPPSPSVGVLYVGSVPNAGTVVVSAFNSFSLSTVTPTGGAFRVVAQGYS